MNCDHAFSITWTQSVEEIPPDLWAAAFPPPLEGLWWYAALEHARLEDQFTFAYALIHRDGRPVGIAPTFLMNFPLDLVFPWPLDHLARFNGRIHPWLRYRRILFVGSPCSEEGAVGLLPGQSLRDVAPALQDALVLHAREVRAALIVWKDFPDLARQALEPLVRSHGLVPSVSFPAARLDLPPGGFAGYLASLKKERRYNIKRKLKLSRQAGELNAEIIQHPDPATLDELFALFLQTYNKGKTKFERLTPDFFRAIAAADVAHFLILRRPGEKNTGRAVAFKLIFLLGRCAINKFIGLDYAQPPDSYLFFRLFEETFNWSEAHGVTEFQGGQTGYRPKLDLGFQLVPLTNFCLAFSPFNRAVLNFIAPRISWSSLDDDLRTHLRAHAE
jgi:hypothetical protein